MKERPILFSGSMVRALLDGRKTQTRRVITPQPFIDARGNVAVETKPGDVKLYGQHPDGSPQWENFARWRCPYGVPGDFFWVKERYRLELGAGKPAQSEGFLVHYDADGEPNAEHEWQTFSRPSIHMPRWASRLTLKITGIKVERLQDIREADAVAEGMWSYTVDGDPKPYHHWSKEIDEGDGYSSARSAYKHLWNEINGDGAWAANPWVWAISFEVARP